MVVKKNNGSLRICLDARALNEIMEDDHNQPTPIDEIISMMGKQSVFSALDLKDAYHHVKLSKESRKYTGFRFLAQTYQYKRNPFGTKSSGGAFIRGFEKNIDEELKGVIVIDIDDLVVMSESYEEHLVHLEKVFMNLDRMGIRLNIHKCKFAEGEVKFLGHNITQGKIKMIQETIKNIKNFPTPKNKRDIQAFLGLVNWDRKFVDKLAQYTKPLEERLKKEVKFQWNDELQEAMDEVKYQFEKARPLNIIRDDRQYGIQTDASDRFRGTAIPV